MSSAFDKDCASVNQGSTINHIHLDDDYQTITITCY